MEVTLGGQTLTLRPITDESVKGDLFSAAVACPTGLHRVYSAALALSWPGAGRKLKKPEARYNYTPLQFGGAVYNELVARGYDQAEILDAGRTAFAAATAGLLTGGDVEEARRFLGGSEEAPLSAPSSQSSGSGESTPAGSSV